MRLTSANIQSFGHFDSCTYKFDMDRVVVVFGPNEAGKTTFASFLKTMLFGFAPAKLDQHPYTPSGDGRTLEGSIEFVSTDRRRCSVHRELKSTPRSQYVSGEGLFGDEEDLRNRSLPAVDHISRRVFESVYAVGLDEMERIEARTWDFIQDRLLGGLHIDYLKPGRVVIESLEQEAKSFWRSDRRGKPIASGLESELRELQRQLRIARDDDRQVRALARKIGELSEQQVSLKKERAALKHRQLVHGKLQPIHNIRKRIAELRDVAGDVGDIADIPDDPLAHLRQFRARKSELQNRIFSLTESVRDGAKTIADFGPDQSRLKQAEDEIRSWGTRVGRHEAVVAELQEAQQQMSEVLRRAEPLAFATFSNTGLSTSEILGALVPVDVESAASLFELLESLEDDERQDRLMIEWQLKIRKAALALVVVGALAGVVGLGLSTMTLVIVGVVLGSLGIAAGTASAWSRRNGDGRRDLDRNTVVLEIENRFAPLRFGEGRWDGRAREVWHGLQRLSDLAIEHERMSLRLKRLQETVDDDNARLRQLAHGLGTDNHAPPTVLIARMMRDLESANYKYRAAESARQRQQPLLREKKLADESSARLVEEEKRLIALLEDLGSGDVQRGAQIARERRRASMYVDELQATLEKDYPDWRQVVEDSERSADEHRVKFDSESVEPDDSLGGPLQIALRLDEVEERLQSLSSRIAAAREQARGLVEKATVSDVESRIEAVKADLLSAKIQRDRRLLIAEILRRSEHLFREENQPDVVRKANEYLKIISGGRYQTLVVDDVTGELKLWSEEEGRLREVSKPLSRGTIDQIYLALRIAIIDHLDRNHERVPVFLDEVFVNWDVRRRARAYAILKNVAKERQVFLFTCHQWMVDEVRELLDAQVVGL